MNSSYVGSILFLRRAGSYYGESSQLDPTTRTWRLSGHCQLETKLWRLIYLINLLNIFHLPHRTSFNISSSSRVCSQTSLWSGDSTDSTNHWPILTLYFSGEYAIFFCCVWLLVILAEGSWSLVNFVIFHYYKVAQNSLLNVWCF